MSTATAPRPFRVLPGKPGRRPRAVPDPDNPPIPRRLNDTLVSVGPWLLRDVSEPEGSGLIVQRPQFAGVWAEAPEFEVLAQDWPAPRRRTHELEALRRLARVSAPQSMDDFGIEGGGRFFLEKRLLQRIRLAYEQSGGVAGWRSMLAPILAQFAADDWGAFGSMATAPGPTASDRLAPCALPEATRNRLAIEDGAGAVEGAYRLEWTHDYRRTGLVVRALRVVGPPKPLPDGIDVAFCTADAALEAWSTTWSTT